MAKEPTTKQFISTLKKITCQKYEIAYTAHAKRRLQERNILVRDILHVIKHGECNSKIEKSTRLKVFKGLVCSNTPNSGDMKICIVVAISFDEFAKGVKIITVMWENEPNEQ